MLGYPWLKKENPNIDWEKETLEWRKKGTSIQLKIPTPTENQELIISYIPETFTDQAREDWMKTCMSHSQLFAIEEEKAKIKPKAIVPKEFHGFLNTVFSERPVGRLPSRMKYNHQIDLKPGFEPMRGAIHRQGPVHDKALQDFLDKNLAKGFIQLSSSPQAASFFFVPKKDGRARPVQDYRYLNKWTVKNAYPIPRIDKLIGKKLFIKMDIQWGYNNVRIREGDEWKAMFSCKFGLYEPLVMFFGLTNSPATFQSMMNNIFQLEILQEWLVDYIDDILLSNKGDCEDLTRKAITVLEKLKQHDLFVKPKKSEFFVTNVSFLGFKVEDGKLAMEQQKVSGIANWPPPETVTQVKSFLCFFNFY